MFDSVGPFGMTLPRALARLVDMLTGGATMDRMAYLLFFVVTVAPVGCTSYREHEALTGALGAFNADIRDALAGMNRSEAIELPVLTDEAPVLYEPMDDSYTVAQMQKGEKVEVIREDEGWLLVRIDESRTGWMHRSTFEPPSGESARVSPDVLARCVIFVTMEASGIRRRFSREDVPATISKRIAAAAQEQLLSKGYGVVSADAVSDKLESMGASSTESIDDALLAADALRGSSLLHVSIHDLEVQRNEHGTMGTRALARLRGTLIGVPSGETLWQCSKIGVSTGVDPLDSTGDAVAALGSDLWPRLEIPVSEASGQVRR